MTDETMGDTDKAFQRGAEFERARLAATLSEHKKLLVEKEETDRVVASQEAQIDRLKAEAKGLERKVEESEAREKQLKSDLALSEHYRELYSHDDNRPIRSGTFFNPDER